MRLSEFCAGPNHGLCDGFLDESDSPCSCPCHREIQQTSSSANVGGASATNMVYVVFAYGDPMPMTSCTTAALAEEYARQLALLPENHPLYTPDAQIDEIPLLSELPAAFRQD